VCHLVQRINDFILTLTDAPFIMEAKRKMQRTMLCAVALTKYNFERETSTLFAVGRILGLFSTLFCPKPPACDYKTIQAP
jgi:hypothetical protein